MPSKFGQLLLVANLITQEQLDQALEYQRTHGGRLGEILNKLGSISSDDLTRTLGMKYGVPTIDLEQVKIERQTLDLITPETARTYRIIPLHRSGPSLICAMEDPARVDSINEVEFQSGCRLQPVLVTSEMMASALQRHYPTVQPSSGASSRTTPPRRSAFIAELTSRMEKLPREKLDYVRRFLDAID